MRILHLVLGEAGLELVPKELWQHPAVRKNAERRGKKPSDVLLDVSIHYSAMRKLRDKHKRGRPDIVHLCLLSALETPISNRGLLRIYIHTYDNRIIYVDPSVKLPRHYLRFVGLMEQLLKEGRVPPEGETKLLWISKEGGIERLIDNINPSRIFLFTEKGVRYKALELASKIVKEEEPLIIIGAFQAGEFSDRVKKLANEKVSIYEEALNSWIIVSRILSSLEIVLGLI